MGASAGRWSIRRSKEIKAGKRDRGTCSYEQIRDWIEPSYIEY